MSTIDFITLITSKTLILSAAVGVCWILFRFFPLRSPTLHRSIWGGVLLLGVIGAGFPLVFFVPVASEPSQNVPMQNTVAPEIFTMPDFPVEVVSPEIQTIPINVSVPENQNAAVAKKEPGIAFVPSIGVMLTAFWFSGVVFLLFRCWNRYRVLCRKLADAVTVTGSDRDQWLTLLNEYTIPHGKIELLLSQEIGPALVRTFHGLSIVVPKNLWEETTPEIKDGILRHELAHFRYHDLTICTVVRILAGIHWFNPLAYFAAAKFNEATEWACDVAAFAHHAQGECQFARAMLAIHDAVPSMTLHRYAFGAGKLSRRAGLLRNFITQPKEKPMKKIIVIGLALFVLILGSVNVRFVAQESPQKTRKKSQPVAVSKDTAATSRNQNPAFVETYDSAVSNSEKPTMTLTILDPDGKPVVGATLKTHRFDRDETRVFKSYTTDENGQTVFELPQKKNNGTFHFAISEPGFAYFLGYWDLKNSNADFPAACTLTLKKGITIGGVVKNEDGKPVAGVKVDFSFPTGNNTNDPSHSRVGSATSATTDAEGRWRYASVPEDVTELRRLALLHPDYMGTSTDEFFTSQLAADAQGNFSNVSIIRRGIAFGGVVKNPSGKPVSEAKVEIEFRDVYGAAELRYRKAISDEQGRFQFENCPVSKQAVVVAQVAGFAGTFRETQVDVNAKPVEITLAPQNPIRLKIVDVHGQPVRNALAWVNSWGPFNSYGVILSNMLRNEKNWNASLILPVDENGVWTWNDAPHGSMEITVCSSNLMNQKVRIAPGEMKTAILFPQLRITGKVVDDTTGKAISRFTVTEGIVFDGVDRIDREDDRPNWQTHETKQQKDGEFTYNSRSRVFQRMFRVEALGYHPCDSRRILSDEGAITLGFRLKPLSSEELSQLKKAETMRAGQIVDPQGNPASYATVIYATNSPTGGISITMHHLEGHAHRSVKADKDGRFTLPAIELDATKGERYAFVVIHENGFRRLEQEEFEKTYNKTAKSDAPTIRLEPWAKLEGTAMTGSKAASNVQIDLSLSNDGKIHDPTPRIDLIYMTKTDDKGCFTFPRVASGRYRISQTLSVKLANNMTANTPMNSSYVSFNAGEDKTVTLGGTGRPVVGRIAIPSELQKRLENEMKSVTIIANPESSGIKPPEIPKELQEKLDEFQTQAEELKNDPEKLQALTKEWEQSETAKKMKEIYDDFMKKNEKYINYIDENQVAIISSFANVIEKDGTFRMEDVPSGKWTLNVSLLSAEFQNVGSAPRKDFEMPPMPGGRSDEPFDLGIIEVSSR